MTVTRGLNLTMIPGGALFLRMVSTLLSISSRSIFHYIGRVFASNAAVKLSKNALTHCEERLVRSGTHVLSSITQKKST